MRFFQFIVHAIMILGTGEDLAKKIILCDGKSRTSLNGWMDEEIYKEFPDCITIRETNVSSERTGFRTISRVIITTFLNPNQANKKQLEELYNQRWMVEINLRSIKEVMCMGILRGKTPAMVRKEIWMHLLAYNLVRKIMAQSASCYRKKPQELSFKLALQMISAFRQARIFLDKDEDSYCLLLRAIAYKKTGNRPGRSEPRAVKRRQKAFPKLQMARHLYTKTQKYLPLS